MRHIQKSYFDNSDLSRWTLNHPYRNPFVSVTLSPPETHGTPQQDAQPWFVDGRRDQSLPWVTLESSLQWAAFQRLVTGLRAQGNRVFIIVGPLNEHMLEPGTREGYDAVLDGVQEWFGTNGFDHLLFPLLPTELYADLSHPLEQGYRLLAEEVWNSRAEGALP